MDLAKTSECNSFSQKNEHLFWNFIHWDMEKNYSLRHNCYSREPYIFIVAKIVTLQILQIYYIKTVFHPKCVYFERFPRCMYVCTSVLVEIDSIICLING